MLYMYKLSLVKPQSVPKVQLICSKHEGLHVVYQCKAVVNYCNCKKNMGYWQVIVHTKFRNSRQWYLHG